MLLVFLFYFEAQWQRGDDRKMRRYKIAGKGNATTAMEAGKRAKAFLEKTLTPAQREELQEALQDWVYMDDDAEMDAAMKAYSTKNKIDARLLKHMLHDYLCKLYREGYVEAETETGKVFPIGSWEMSQTISIALATQEAIKKECAAGAGAVTGTASVPQRQAQQPQAPAPSPAVSVADVDNDDDDDDICEIAGINVAVTPQHMFTKQQQKQQKQQQQQHAPTPTLLPAVVSSSVVSGSDDVKHQLSSAGDVDDNATGSNSNNTMLLQSVMRMVADQQQQTFRVLERNTQLEAEMRTLTASNLQMQQQIQQLSSQVRRLQHMMLTPTLNLSCP